MKIIDVALDAGFNTAESYQRAFCKEFGLNPKEYSMNPILIPLFNPYNVEYKNQKEKDMKQINCIFVTQVEKPARRVIIKRGIMAADYFEYCEEVGCDIWGYLLSIKGISPEPVCM